MADYVLSNKADDDLDGIYVYSCQTFGEARADSYYQDICKRLNSLASNPHLGRSIDQIQTGLFCNRCARHIIFYTVEADGIFVVRVLHDAMDIRHHLTSD